MHKVSTIIGKQYSSKV